MNAFVRTAGVSDLVAKLAGLQSAGGTLAQLRMAVPGAGAGWLAYGKDPDGNILGVMQADASAR